MTWRLALIGAAGLAVGFALLWIAIGHAIRRGDEQAQAVVDDERTTDIKTGLRRGDPYVRNHVGRHDVWRPEVVYPGTPHRRQRRRG